MYIYVPASMMDTKKTKKIKFFVESTKRIIIMEIYLILLCGFFLILSFYSFQSFLSKTVGWILCLHCCSEMHLQESIRTIF